MAVLGAVRAAIGCHSARSEEHTSELQSRGHLVCRLLLEKKNLEDKLQAGTYAGSDKWLDLIGIVDKTAADKGKDSDDHIATAFHQLNALQRDGTAAVSVI